MIHYIYSNHECDSKGKRLNLFRSVDCNLVIPCEIEMIACQNSIIVNEHALSQPDSWSQRVLGIIIILTRSPSDDQIY